MKLILSVFCLILLLSCNIGGDNATPVEDPIIDTVEVEESPEEERDADDRQYWQKPGEVISMLGNLENKVVADLGAGIGYFAFKLIRTAKKVIAIDVDPVKIDVLEGFKSGLPEEQSQKLEIRLATPDDSKLDDNEADIVLIVNTIAYIGNRVEYFRKLKNKLSEGGQIAIVDFKTKIIPSYVNAPPYDEREYLHVIEEELIKAGYQIIVTDDTSLEYQYMIFAQAMSE